MSVSNDCDMLGIPTPALKRPAPDDDDESWTVEPVRKRLHKGLPSKMTIELIEDDDDNEKPPPLEKVKEQPPRLQPPPLKPKPKPVAAFSSSAPPIYAPGELERLKAEAAISGYDDGD